MPNTRTISTHTFPPMSRYRGPRLRITRRLGDLPGLTRKAAKRSYPPGQHGQARRKRSEYAIRLEEKQKLRFNYGVSERQLVRYVKKARAQEGSTGTNLLKLLENRLDNVCFRLGFGPTVPGAHGRSLSCSLVQAPEPPRRIGYTHIERRELMCQLRTRRFKAAQGRCTALCCCILQDRGSLSVCGTSALPLARSWRGAGRGHRQGKRLQS